MDNSSYQYASFSAADATMEDTTDISMFSQWPGHAGMVEDNYTLAPNPYPILRSPPFGPTTLSPHFEPPQVKRYLTEDPTTSLSTASSCLNTMSTNTLQRPLQPKPIPGQGQFHMQPRLASPMSSLGYPVTAPSATPDRETLYDNNNNNNVPVTPSDSAVMSPGAGPCQPEPYSRGEYAMQYVHMGPSGYIKPEDVEPSPQLGFLDPEPGQLDLQFGQYQQAQEIEHGATHQMMEFGPGQANYPIRTRHSTSPNTDAIIVKLGDSHTDEYGSSDVSKHSAASKRKNVDSDGFQGKKRKTSSSSSRKSRAKPASAQPRSGEGPLKATPKTSSKRSTSTSGPAGVHPYSGIKPPYPCPRCNQGQFQERTSLENHIKKEHTRPFICVFHFAGCKSDFPSKNEWKRHVSAQHLVLQYWRCKEGANPSHCNKGAVFKRHDLFTQHFRRMHTKPATKKALGDARAATARSAAKKSCSSSRPPAINPLVVQWLSDLLPKAQAAAWTVRVTLPTYMRCPAVGCGADFHGKTAWDDRMEHVAKHLESGDREVVFGGEGDETLMAWLAGEGVGIVERDGDGWRVSDPLKEGKVSSGEKKGGKGIVRGNEYADGDGETDAEGEEDE